MERTPAAGSDEAPATGVRAAIGRRIAAAILDLIVLGVLFVGLALIFGQSDSSQTSTSSTAGGSVNVSLSGWPFLLYVLLAFAYYLAPEALFGRTLGKWLLGLRVVRQDGDRCGWSAALVRNLLRVVDGLPLLYLVGFICMMASVNAQRLGDRAAATLVVLAR